MRNQDDSDEITKRSLPNMDDLLQKAALSFNNRDFIKTKELCETILKEIPDQFIATHLLSVSLGQLGDYDDALKMFQHAINLQPNNPNVFSDRGTVYRLQNRLEEALISYDVALKLNPDFADAYYNRGNAYLALDRLDEALESYNRALELKPNMAFAYHNRGEVYRILNRLDDALANYSKSIELMPARGEFYCNRAIIYQSLNRFPEALNDYNKALELNPQLVDIYYNRALCYLAAGDFKRGWQEHEWRWSAKQFKNHKRHFTQPLWLGEPLLGKVILLHAEQGYGDSIQFCRYVSVVADLGAKVLLEVPKSLVDLMTTALSPIAQISECGTVSTHFDYHCPLMTVPLALSSRLNLIPSKTPYLYSAEDKRAKWSKKLGLKTTPRIGIAWCGNNKHGNDHNRSMSLSCFMQVIPEDIQCIILQKHIPQHDMESLANYPQVTFLGNLIEDFNDTAALTDLMDLILCVDTSIAHLGGALNKPVWLLLCYGADWRWLTYRTDSPWYPSMHLYRQPAPGDWNSLLAQVKEDVRQLFGRTSLQSTADSAEAHALKGQALQEANEQEQALIHYTKAIELNPDFVEVYVNRGVVLQTLNRLNEALDSYNKAIALKPDFSQAYSNRGLILHRFSRFLEALADYNKAIELNPNFSEAYSNRGMVLRSLDKPEEAIASYNHALALNPNYAEAYSNLGHLYLTLNLVDDALKSLNKSLELNPNSAEAHLNKGLCYLIAGNFEAGWKDYEWRWCEDQQKSSERHFKHPLWSGMELLTDKVILIHAEQGLGDTLQFCRYVNQLARLGAKVLLEVQKPLVTLLGSLKGVAQIIEAESALPDFDYHCPLLSLPLAFNTSLATIPIDVPYLAGSEEKRTQWANKLGTKMKPRIGLVWSGSRTHKNDSKRSIDLSSLLHALPSGIQYVSLQKDLRDKDKEAMSHYPELLHYGDGLNAFDDTAALCSLMDLIITVDTSVAHLAGALGCPTWLLLPFAPDWRWLLNRADSPWYPTMKLYRQPSLGDWDAVLERVKTDLNVLFFQIDLLSVSEMLQKAFSYFENGELIQARELGERILANSPDNFNAIQLLGMVVWQQGDLAHSLIYFNRAVELQPDNAQALFNRAVLLGDLKRYEEAIAGYNQVLKLKPNNTAAFLNCGAVFQTLNRQQEALDYYNKALEINPYYSEAYSNRGATYQSLNLLSRALANYNKAISLNPGFLETYYNRSLCYLLGGDFAAGWKEHEWRWESVQHKAHARHFEQPLWLGKESLAGKVILLHAEQGLGDTIQFCRYASQVSELGAKVVLEVQPVLAELLQSLQGVQHLVIKDSPLPAFDYHCPLLSLPLAFNTLLESIPATVPYLTSSEDRRNKWISKLGQKNKPRIGLVWQGNPSHINDHNRSIPLKSLLEAIPLGVQCISLQKDSSALDSEILINHPELMHLGDELKDFADTAALCELMDLIITVDTSVAHLAGAMNKTTWVLLPFAPDWRWLLERTDSPWYPSMTLYRQQAVGDWDGVLLQLKDDLLPLVINDAENAEYYYNQAHELQTQNQLRDAITSYEKAIELNPNYEEAYCNLGYIYQVLNYLDVALVHYQKAIALNTRCAQVYSNCGVVLRALNRFEEAVACYDKAIELKPDYAEAYCNRGHAYKYLNRLDDAFSSLNKAIELKPDMAEAYFIRGLCHLLVGNFTQGLRDYEWRWETKLKARFTNRPELLWRGQDDIPGKKILLWAEQGFGDTLQFCRYALELVAMGAIVLLEVPKELKPLLHYSLKQVSRILSRDDVTPEFDYHSSLMSLPFAFNTTLATIPAPIPYLFSMNSMRVKWESKLGEKTSPRVGLVWSGRKTHKNDRNRSISLEELLQAIPEGVQCVGLQKEIRDADLITLKNHPELIYCGDELADFSDTAALCDLMDLIISVDTSVAHLAGAMNKAIWVLLPFAPDWRWLLARKDSPWYPQMRLYRQQVSGDWHDVFLQIKEDAQQLLFGEHNVQEQEELTALESNNPLVYFDRGYALQKQNCLEEALEQYKKAIELKPDYPIAYSNSGVILRKLNRSEEALAAYDKAINLEPNYSEAYFNRGLLHKNLNQLEKALVDYNQSIELNPSFAQAYSERGLVFQKLNRFDAALDNYNKAIELKPDYTEVYSNRGGLYQLMNRLDEALEQYNKALELDPNYADIYVNRALCHLVAGRFELGFKDYEWRWSSKQLKGTRTFTQPLWLGQEPIFGKVLLLPAEQGYGDSIQFCRYVPKLIELGARVLLEVPHSLVGLMATLKETAQIISKGDALPEFDYYCPLLSLPLALNTTVQTIPAHTPYLYSTEDKQVKWSNRLGLKTKPRVGIVWSGNKTHQFDHHRSIALELLLTAIPSGVQCISLQKNPRQSDLSTLANHPEIVHFGGELESFSDTAALCDLMDLIISVDTSVAHLAGALNKSAWVLLAFAPDWRWLLERRDSPWYPSLSLYRQAATGDWDGVLHQVKEDLSHLFPTSERAITESAHLIKTAFSLYQNGDYAEARALCDQILQGEPEYFDALHLLGVITAQLGEYQYSLAHYDKALAIKPDSADVYSNRGVVLHNMNHLEDALLSYDNALKLQPNLVQAYSNKGLILRQLNRLEEALTQYNKAIELEPNFAEAYSNRGIALRALKRFDEALLSYNKAISLKPDYVEAYANLGYVYHLLSRFDEAFASCNKAIAINPHYAAAYCNRGHVYLALNDLEHAIADFNTAIDLNPNFVEAHLNRSLCNLLLGHFEEGWKEYEWRWLEDQFKPHARHFSQPQWLGKESLAGKTILLHAEQGFGDTFQFCRYVPMLSQLGAKVIMELPVALASLMGSLAGLSHIVIKGFPLPDFDYHCPLLSLPLAFHTTLQTIPVNIPYLSGSGNSRVKWAYKLGEKKAPRIGLVWSGNASHKNDHNRSIALGHLLQAIPPGIQCISLQKDLREADLITLNNHPEVLHFGNELNDFDDTAALCHLMDLIISVDTSVVHLAGALGCPAWLLLPFAPDWRWLLNRKDSPWYPTFTLYRQDAHRQWDGVLDEMKERIKQVFSLPLKVEEAGDPDAYFKEAMRFYTLNRFHEALACYNKAIALKPDYANAYSNRGVVFELLNRPLEALDSYNRALELNPNFAQAYLNRGVVLQTLNRLDDALGSYSKALEIKPDYAEAYSNQGAVLQRINRLDEALACFNKAIELKPDYGDAYFNCGTVLQAQNHLDEALFNYKKALALNPDRVKAYFNCGSILLAQKRWEEALTYYNKVIELKPDYVDAYSHRGVVLHELNRSAEALMSYDKAIELHPSHAEAFSNRGIVLHELQRSDEALASYNKAVEWMPNFTDALFNRALHKLLNGDFSSGWNDYESRLAKEPHDRLKGLVKPRWSGKESLAGKILLCVTEQGLGDVIQFCRYVPLLAQLGAQVILEVPEVLINLLTPLEGVAQIRGKGADFPEFDYYCPLLSLPRAFNTRLETIPNQVPYLFSTEDKRTKWSQKLGAKNLPRIGLIWSGNPAHNKDNNRSLPLERLLQVIPEGMECVSLQKEIRKADEQTLASHPKLRHFGDELNDFTDTAALCDLMDLIISVDTSGAHLAGALNKPTWVLVSFTPDWRWLLNRTDSPWYPSMTLYRQHAIGDWNAVLAQINEDLLHLLSGG